MSWKLIVLSGIHQGAEIALSNGDIAIGSDDLEADLVLSDKGVAPIQLRIVINQESIILTEVAQEQEIRFGNEIVHLPGSREGFDQGVGEEIKLHDQEGLDSNQADSVQEESGQESNEESEPGIELPSLRKISVGNFLFAIAREDEEWPSFDEEPEIVKTDEPVKEEKKEGVAFGLIAGIVIGLFVVLLLFLPFIISGDKTSTEEVSDRVDSMAWKEIRAVVNSLDLNDVNVDWNSTSGKVFISGFVPTSEDRSQLIKKLDALKVPYEVKVNSIEKILEGVRFVLANSGYSKMKVEPGKVPGTVVLIGMVEDQEGWNRVEHILESDVQGLQAWRVESPKNVNQKVIDELLNKYNLHKKLQVFNLNDKYELRGQLSEEDLSSYKKMETEYSKNNPEGLPLELKLSEVERPGIRIEFPVRSITVGVEPHVMLTNNQIYFQGGVIPGGFRIKEITQDKVDLSKGDRVFSIKIGGKNESKKKNNNDGSRR